MNEIQKQIQSIQDHIITMNKMISDLSNQIAQLIKGATSQLGVIEHHTELIATLQKEIENLKAKPNKQLGF